MSYRRIRNECSRDVKGDKRKHVTKLYDNIVDEKNTGNLFKITRELLHWKNGNTPGQFLIEGNLITRPMDYCKMPRWTFTYLKLRKIKTRIEMDKHRPTGTTEKSC